MAISLIKEFKQKQKISLTPLLKKSIDLLQLSRYELIQKIDREIEVNPFVEKELTDDIEYDENYNDSDFDFNLAAVETLRDSLINQVNDLNLNENEKIISLNIIDCLDESGQLVDELEDIAEMMQKEVSTFEINEVLVNIIQDLEPAGIGFRNFKECIKIQIKKKNLNKGIKSICLEILDQNQSESLDEIVIQFTKKGYSNSQIDKAMNEIKSCDLSPGLNFENINYIIPDLKIELKNQSLNVEFINDTFPKIKIDEDLIEKTNIQLKKNPNKQISEKIQNAKWLLSSIKKRNDTVMQVGELICKRQISFLQDNPLKINPLSNKNLSDELGLHPSTISRILRSKYIDTPKGIIPLKSLLVSSVSKTRDVTPIQLMQLIESIIENEKKPKSDNKIALELNKRGFNLARRTITKYRKKLNIASSRNR
ncbi:MAG: RNA polymerase factor sigma-54 [Gammaproteobacteria bacterium]|jgi:RNA polymerase sigma-54 factor|tara:strand:+ start:119 stop:1393 length:1275 start_codon:yes stop_codon:yes gene_type:complete